MCMTVGMFSVTSMLEMLDTVHFKSNLGQVSVCPPKTQISLGIRPVWSESSLCPQWVAKDPSFLHADSEDSDQTGQMPRLIWVFAGRTATLLVLSCRGSSIVVRLLPWWLTHAQVSYSMMNEKRVFFFMLLNNISDMPGQWKGNDEGLYATKHQFGKKSPGLFDYFSDFQHII